jgi:hypothetical protein
MTVILQKLSTELSTGLETLIYSGFQRIANIVLCKPLYIGTFRGIYYGLFLLATSFLATGTISVVYI